MKAYLEPEEVKKLENAAGNLRDRLLVRLLFRLGCRISEALAIGVEDIGFSSGIIMIKHLKQRVRYNCPECQAGLAVCNRYCPNCGVEVTKAQQKEMEHRRMRTLPIDDVTLDMLRDYIKRGGPVSRNGKLLIFGVNRHRGWQIVRNCAERAGLPKLINSETGKLRNVSPHRLRDAFAVNAVRHDDSGDGLCLLQEHLGHTNFNTTARYRKVAGDELRQWYEKLWKDENAH